MIETTDGVALDPAGGEVHAAVSAAGVDHVGLTALAAEEGVVDAHDAHGLGMARQKVVGVVDGLPEGAHVPASQGVRAGMEEVGLR